MTSAELGAVLERAEAHWLHGCALRRRLPDRERMRGKHRFVARAVALLSFWTRPGKTATPADHGSPRDPFEASLRAEHRGIANRLLNALEADYRPRGGDPVDTSGSVADVARRVDHDIGWKRGMGQASYQALLALVSSRGLRLRCGCRVESACSEDEAKRRGRAYVEAG